MKLKLGLRKAAKLALLFEAAGLAVLFGSEVAWAFTDEGKCVSRQEAIYLRNEYEHVPARARGGAQIWCKKHNNVPQSDPDVERTLAAGRF